MLATDRDLLALEPRVFHEAAWLGQRVRVNEAASIQDSGATVVDSGGPFVPGRIEAGGVLLLDGLAVEVASIANAQTAAISLVRASVEDPAIPASTLGATARLEAFTFRPQLELAHRETLALFGLVSGDPVLEGEAPVASVSDTRSLALVEAATALWHVYESAAPVAGGDDRARAKAERYRRWRERLARSVAVALDDTGDGVADRVVRASVLALRRA